MSRTLLLASAAVGTAMLQLGAAQAQVPFDWSGFYIGVHGGVLNGDVTVHEGLSLEPGGNISGWVAGPLVGYNFPTSPLAPFVFGAEADFGWANVTGAGGMSEDCNVDYLYDLNWDAHFRLRAALPMGQFTPFLAGGLALADLNIRQGCGILQEGGLFAGGTVGGGVDMKLMPNLAIRGEVLYDFYGRHDYNGFSADFNAWTTRAALIIKLR